MQPIVNPNMANRQTQIWSPIYDPTLWEQPSSFSRLRDVKLVMKLLGLFSPLVTRQCK